MLNQTRSDSSRETATTTPTRFVETEGRKIAYRSLGQGPALLLCVRFRGVLDSWDPAFLDALANDFRVITFDYTGLGSSTGTPSYRPQALAKDALDLADALDLDRFVIGGWSLGGVAAQIVAAENPVRVSHGVFIGTSPPGPLEHPTEPVFFQHALKPENDLDDEIVLFFEPDSAGSRAAARASHDRIAARKQDTSPPIEEKTFLRLLEENPHEEVFFDGLGYEETLRRTRIPLLVISGDHEIVFPVQNWFSHTRKWDTLHLVVLPRMGHGPQQEAPEFCARLIAAFVQNRRAP